MKYLNRKLSDFEFDGDNFQGARVEVNKHIESIFDRMKKFDSDAGEVTLKIKFSLIARKDEFEQDYIAPIISTEVTSKVEHKLKENDVIMPQGRLTHDKYEGWALKPVPSKQLQLDELLHEASQEDEDDNA